MSFKSPMFREPAEVEIPGAATETPSIAQLMATKGVVNNTMTPIAEPIDVIPEKKEETTEPEKVTPAATATEPKKVVETKTESPAKVEPEKVETPQKAEETKKELSWQEVLKQQPDTEVLKALGLDEKAINLAKKLNGFEKVDYFDKLLSEWIETGKIDTFARELSTDYAKMPAGEVMRHQLRQEYPKASEKALDVLYRKEVVEKFNLESDDDVEKEEGQMLLEAKADKFRDDFISKQSAYLTPKPPEPAKEVVPDNTAAIERQKEIERIHKNFEDSPYTKNILSNKAITIGEGDDKFTYPLETEKLLSLIKDGDKTGEITFTNIQRNPDGSIKSGDLKPENEILANAMRLYGMDFIDKLANHFKSKGGSKAIASIDNAKPADTGQPVKSEAEPKTVAEHMAKSGRISNPS